jgi:outer membrane lipoprotein-sorting protein
MIRPALSIVLLVWPMIAKAQSSAPSTRPDLTAVLDTLDARAAQISDLSADFEQKKFTTLTTDPLVSSGAVRACDDVARWDTQAPQPSVLYSNGREFRLYYPDQKLEEIYPVGASLSDMLSSPLPRFHALAAHFRIETADISALSDLGNLPHANHLLVVRLVPTDDSIRQHIQEVVLAIDSDQATALAMRTVDADGDRTDVLFRHVKMNTGMKAGDLDLQIPAGTTVSHPLEGAGQAP